jgi:hypothetical protein
LWPTKVETTICCGEQSLNALATAIRARFVPLWFQFLTLHLRASHGAEMPHRQKKNATIIGINAPDCKTLTSKHAP